MPPPHIVGLADFVVQQLLDAPCFSDLPAFELALQQMDAVDTLLCPLGKMILELLGHGARGSGDVDFAPLAGSKRTMVWRERSPVEQTSRGAVRGGPWSPTWPALLPPYLRP